MTKTLLLILSLSTTLVANAQTSGTITIGKTDTTSTTDTTSPSSSDTTSPSTTRDNLIHLTGLFYSDWVRDQIRTGNSVSSQQTRYYFYCNDQREIYFFRSAGKPKKIAKSFMKDPGKFAEEVGKYELNDGILYIETGSLTTNQVFRYTGEANSTKMWIEMKAAYHKKVQLNLYLSKYIE